MVPYFSNLLAEFGKNPHRTLFCEWLSQCIILVCSIFLVNFDTLADIASPPLQIRAFDSTQATFDLVTRPDFVGYCYSTNYKDSLLSMAVYLAFEKFFALCIL